MAKLKGIDWDEVAKSEVIEEGDYPVRIDKVEKRQSRNEPEGPGYLNVEMTFLEDPYTGRKIWDVFSLKPNALWKLRNLCETLGIDLEGRTDFDTDELVGQEVGIRAVPETYEGKDRAKVDSYFSMV